MTPPAELPDATQHYPADGAVRVHPTPDQLPRRRDKGELPRYRFDDPDDPGVEAYSVRYLARSLYGCLLELLAQFRPANQETTGLLAGVTHVDDDDAHRGQAGRGAAEYLRKVNVGRAHLGAGPGAGPLHDINDPRVLAWLDTQRSVRAVLDDPEHILAWGTNAHVDEGKIRLDMPHGYPLTQACSRALHDRHLGNGGTACAGISYRSKHDDQQQCWALYDHTRVAFTDVRPLEPTEPNDRGAVLAVAELWDIDVSGWAAPSSTTPDWLAAVPSGAYLRAGADQLRQLALDLLQALERMLR